jgi:hypothetical protein
VRIYICGRFRRRRLLEALGQVVTSQWIDQQIDDDFTAQQTIEFAERDIRDLPGCLCRDAAYAGGAEGADQQDGSQ